MAAQVRAQRPIFASTGMSGLTASTSGTARTGSAATGVSAAAVVNFAPSIVINGAMEPNELGRRVIEAIGRHSHELVRIITRELQSKRRAML